MILYVITDTPEQYQKLSSWHDDKIVLEKLSGDICLVMSYKRLRPEYLKELKPWAVVHSGTSTSFSSYDILRDLHYQQTTLTATMPQIGICGGHQILGVYFGSTVKTREKVEDGFKQVKIIQRNLLFEELPEIITVKEYHKWEIGELGQSLELLAESDECKVQAWKHRTQDIYGVQFHPELANAQNPHGWVILRNFFKLAKVK